MEILRRLCWLASFSAVIFSVPGRLVAQIAVEPLTSDAALKQRPVFSPDGDRLMYARHLKETIQLIVRNMKDGSEERLNPDNKNPEYDGDFSPDGRLVVFAYDAATPNQGNIDVHLATPSSREHRPVFSNFTGLSHEEWPSWSPDGKRIAFTTTADGNQELYVADIDGENRVRLTSDPAIDGHPAWSPDGSTIAFSTNRWGDLEIVLINPDGSNLRRLTDASGMDDYPVWSPDGRQLAFTSNRDGNFEVYLMNADGSRQRNLTQDESLDSFPSFHPDGRLIFTSDRTGGFEIYLSKQPVLR